MKQKEVKLFFDTLQRCHLTKIFQQINQYAKDLKDCQIWVVGGFIRDSLLGKVALIPDIDLVVSPKTASLSVTKELYRLIQEASDKFGETHYFVLDKQRDTYRIVGPLFQIDVNGIRGECLMDDLFCRDFSINSLCFSLSDIVQALQQEVTTLPLIDFFGGISDLENNMIRAQNPRSLEDDPLRILRAFRMMGRLDGSIEENTFDWMIHAKEKLSAISKERIRDEFCFILDLPHSFVLLELMDECGILDVFFPFLSLFWEIDQTYTKKLQVKQHTKAILYYLEALLNLIEKQAFPYGSVFQTFLEKKTGGNRTVRLLLKLGGLLHDIGKPSTLSLEGEKLRFFDHELIGATMAVRWMEEYKFAGAEIDFLRQLIESHMRPHNLSNSEPLTNKAKYRFFRECSEISIPLLLLALADAYATRMVPLGELPEYENFLREMLSFYTQPQKINPCPLVNGNEVMDILSIPPGKMVGEILEQLLEMQSLGSLSTKEEAILYIKNKKL